MLYGKGFKESSIYKSVSGLKPVCELSGPPLPSPPSQLMEQQAKEQQDVDEEVEEKRQHLLQV